MTSILIPRLLVVLFCTLFVLYFLTFSVIAITCLVSETAGPRLGQEKRKEIEAVWNQPKEDHVAILVP
jgi:hypothetical protein